LPELRVVKLEQPIVEKSRLRVLTLKQAKQKRKVVRTLLTTVAASTPIDLHLTEWRG